MRKINIVPSIYFMGGLLTVFLLALLFSKEPSVNPTIGNFTLKEIDDKSLLITSAGQSTDTYIIQDIINELRLHNLFMPQATSLDTESTRALMIVIGYSEVGMRLHNKAFEEEYQRINALLKIAQDAKIPVISIYIGGKERRSSMTEQLLALTLPQSNFIITTYSGDEDHKLTTLASQYSIPISLVKQPIDMTEPLASVFR